MTLDSVPNVRSTTGQDDIHLVLMSEVVWLRPGFRAEEDLIIRALLFVASHQHLTSPDF